MSDLKPCPFCGNEYSLMSGEMAEGSYMLQPGFVFCCECGAEISECKTEAEAIEAWNRRAERKKGKWIVHDYTLGRERYECTECKGRCDLEYNFCPHCGAEMERK